MGRINCSGRVIALATSHLKAGRALALPAVTSVTARLALW
jgi:hypothetical protein